MPSTSNYVCVGCELEMYPLRNNVLVEEHTGYDSPYKIWYADVWKCPLCQTEIIAGFGAKPATVFLEERDYKKLKKRVKYHIRETAELALAYFQKKRVL